MPPSIVQQFGNMLSSRWRLKKDASPSLKQKPLHEVARYPQVIDITPENNSCLNPSMSYEHILECRHIIVTARPDEPCAPNCYHIASNNSSKDKGALKRSNVLNFYCDACMETGSEALMSNDVSSLEAGNDGTVEGQYTPRANHHPFDTTIPRVGDNFFEDVLTNPVEELNPTSDSGASASASTFEDGTDVDSSPAHLGEGGSNYLRYTRSTTHNKGKAAAQEAEPILNTASKTPSRHAGKNPPIARSADTALPVPAQWKRKRPIVTDEDDDYVDTLEEETVVFKRPAKRHTKSTIATSTVPAAKTKPGRPMKSAINTPSKPATKRKTRRLTKKRS
ncbi:hypothetical protein J4E82_001656 [Alternaria postmessia]|uniref:uncharacterized protein n=1 Tax=Alternaria postmessia TaxID=1187938 RepID=UPI0022247D96|nr:uncharacterized protein J4E82_001656 [Alternaria postmessia]KAI5379616.1 hypothetical protein J4E82_001656 [Alternaria postmessia]